MTACHATATVVCAHPHAPMTLAGGLAFLALFAAFITITILAGRRIPA